MRRLIPLAVVAILLFGSCHTTKEITLGEPLIEVQETTSLYAKTTFSCEADGISAQGQCRMQRDSVIWLSVSKYIELGRVLMTPDSMAIWVKPYNKYYHNTYADFRAKTGFYVDFQRLQQQLWQQPDAAAAEIAQWGKLFGSAITVEIIAPQPCGQLTFPMPKLSTAQPLF